MRIFTLVAFTINSTYNNSIVECRVWVNVNDAEIG